MKRLLASMAVGLLLAAHELPAMATPDAQTVVRETTDKVLETLRTERDTLKKDPARLYEIIDKLILPHFDFMQMSKWVLGRYWREANPAQREQFVRQFQALLVRTYSQALADYSGQNVQYLAPRERSETDVSVRAKIDQPGGPAIPITYEMHRTDGGWKVYDVAVDGVSLVINYRSSFTQLVSREGIDGLIKRLAEKNKAENG